MKGPDVTRSLQGHVLMESGDAVPVEMALQYHVVDQHAVRALFVGAGITVEWVFARDLLRKGLLRPGDAPEGKCDVRVWSTYSGARPVVILALSSPEGDAAIEIDMVEVREFLDATTALVPYDEERVDVDTMLAQILASVTK